MYDRHMHAYDKAHVTVKWNAQDKKSVLFIIKNVKNNRVDRRYDEQVVFGVWLTLFSGLKPSCYRSLKWINISIIAFTIIKRENNLKFKECEICSQLPKTPGFLMSEFHI